MKIKVQSVYNFHPIHFVDAPYLLYFYIRISFVKNFKRNLQYNIKTFG